MTRALLKWIKSGRQIECSGEGGRKERVTRPWDEGTGRREVTCAPWKIDHVDMTLRGENKGVELQRGGREVEVGMRGRKMIGKKNECIIVKNERR